MNTISLFLLKASFGIMMLYLVYYLFLRKETLFRVNRYYLLFSLLISLLLPIISIRYTVLLDSEPGAASSALSLFSRSENGDGISGFMGIAGSIGLVLYLSGAAAFLFRLLWQITILYTLIITSGKKNQDGITIVENSRYVVPFSFMNYVFINSQYINHNELENIIAHEKVHIRERHWFDLLVVEFLTIILWFNPFVWLIERSIKQNHEYLADEGVIAQGYSIGRYYSVLINQLMGIEVIGLTNNLNYSLNAKRLKMMKKEKTPRQRAYRLIWALPVIAILLAAFSQPQYAYTGAKEDVVSILPVSLNKDVQVSVKLKDKSGDAIPGANLIIKGTKKGAVTDKNGMAELNLSDGEVVIISMKGFQDIVLNSEVITKKGTEKNGTYSLDITMIPINESPSKATDLTVLEKEYISKSKMLEKDMQALKMKRSDFETAYKDGKVSQEEYESNLKMFEKKKKELSLKKSEIDNTLKKIQLKKEAEKK